MSEKSKINRARRKAKEEQQAKNVIKWLTIALVIGGLLFLFFALKM